MVPHCHTVYTQTTIHLSRTLNRTGGSEYTIKPTAEIHLTSVTHIFLSNVVQRIYF